MGEKLDGIFEVPGDAWNSEDPFEDFIQEVDELLVDLAPEEMEALPAEPPPVQDTEQLKEAYDEMRQTFLAIMQQVLKPVTRYIKAVINGTEDRELFEIINFTVTPLIDKVEQVQLFEHTSKMLELKTILTRILATHFGSLSDEMRQELVSTYMEIKDAFDLNLRGSSRAVRNILHFYRMMCFHRDIDVEQIRKFFAIGIPSVTWIRKTSMAEIDSLSGMGRDQVRVMKRLADHYREPQAEEMWGREISPPPMMASL